MDRWNVFRGITDYSGKRILELGCNMGLLSTHLLKDAGAAAAMAVDRNPKVLDAARMVNCAFNVEATLLVQDFDASEEWETKLAAFEPDIVFALSVLNWVEDKQRFLKFLGRFPEVVFEGHECFEWESRRLASVGFTRVDRVGKSERNRYILHCRK